MRGICVKISDGQHYTSHCSRGSRSTTHRVFESVSSLDGRSQRGAPDKCTPSSMVKLSRGESTGIVALRFAGSDRDSRV
jgi:hypothetical protein